MHLFENPRFFWKRLIALLLPAFLLVACIRYNKIAPDEMIEGDGLRARVEFMERCWQGCTPEERITFHERWGKLDESDYRKQLGLSYELPPHGLILLPKRKSFLTIFHSSNDGSILVEIGKPKGKLHMTPRAGCMELGGPTLSRLGVVKSHMCRRVLNQAQTPSFQGPGIIYPAFEISLHGAFWVDYRDESVHEIAQGAPDYEDFIGIGGLDDNRQHLLALYKTDVPQHYKVCAFGGGVASQAANRYCVEFDSDVPMDTEALRLASKPTMHAIKRVNAFTATEPLAVSQHHIAWLSQHLVFKAGESPFSSASGKLPLTISSDNVTDFDPSTKDKWPAAQ